MNFLIYSLLVALSVFQMHNCLQTELSMLIDPGQRECLNQYLSVGLKVEVDYQVISGGELDISFWISTPSNRVLHTDIKKQGNQYQFNSEEEGEYRFCLDNSFSRFSVKQVFFFISTDEHFVDPHFPAQSVFENLAKFNKDQLGELENKIESFRQSFQRVIANLEKAQRFQNIFRVYEVIDRSLMESSFDRVNFWSVFNIIVLLLVGGLQVYMIRSLFEDKSKLGKVLRGKESEKRSFT